MTHHTPATPELSQQDAPKWVDRPLTVEEMRTVAFTYGEDQLTGSISSERTFADGSKAYKVEYPQAYIDSHEGSELPAYVHESVLIDPRQGNKNGLGEHLIARHEASTTAELAKAEPEPFDPDDIGHTRIRTGGEFKDQRTLIEEARSEALAAAESDESPSNYDFLLDPNYEGGSVEAARVDEEVDEGERLARLRAQEDNVANHVNRIDLQRRGF